MDKTVAYFSSCLTSSMMNRLVNEQASSLKDCYEQLREEINLSGDDMGIKQSDLANLEQAYHLILKEVGEVEETVHI